MTRRQDVERYRHSLGEIREIMNSMKSLAYLESRKLARFLDAQHAVIECLENVAADFLKFHPETLPAADERTSVYLAIGTERGFCGALNQALMRHLDPLLEPQEGTRSVLIAVGRKLHALLDKGGSIVVLVEGASIVEEVPVVLSEIVRELSVLQRMHGRLNLYGLYHGGENGIVSQQLLPPLRQCLLRPSSLRNPPALTLPPAVFMLELADHYLFAAMHEMLYVSLMTENHNRMTHLEGAVRHLDDEADKLARQCNALRQEEIIEEIEVILLNAGYAAEDISQHKLQHHDAQEWV